MKVYTVSTIKASIKEVEIFVNYHLNIGIDHMYLFFDDPNDVCINHFNKYNDITIIKCNKEHWDRLDVPEDASIELRQISNANYTLSLIEKSHSQWLIHIDVDELIYPKYDLKNELSNVNTDLHAVIFKTMEAIPEKLEYKNIFYEITLFKDFKANWRYRKLIAYILGCRSVFIGGYFKAHLEGKTAVRTDSDISSINIHRPIFNIPEKMEDCKTIRLLHYDCCEYESWYRKWMRRIDGSGEASQLGKPRQKQYQHFIDSLNSGENSLKSLYHSLYIIPKPKLYILRALGFIKKIKLNHTLFKI